MIMKIMIKIVQKLICLVSVNKLQITIKLNDLLRSFKNKL